MGKKNAENDGPTDLRRQAREVADSLAIAFILAMVIRHYVLEVFKIPTKSMQPTLLGDPWTGDKILVNKFAYDFRDPRRWEIAVFKYPVDTSRNYIKRVVGLPGERIRVRYGDVYINGRIARKPWPVQEALWRRRLHSDEARSWQPDDDRAWSLADGEFAVACEGLDPVQNLTYRREILAYEDQDAHVAGRTFTLTSSDIMVEFFLVPRTLAGVAHIFIDIESAAGSPDLLDQWNVQLPLAAEGSRPQLFRSGALVSVGEPYALRAGHATHVQVCNVDQTLLVRVAGREVVRHEYEPSRRIFEWPGFGSQARVRLGCKRGSVLLRRPGVFVDVYYTRSPDRFGVNAPYELGPSDFFVMGDNSANSNDSRYWEAVPRSYLVGEAFLVLWPLGRMKLVR